VEVVEFHLNRLMRRDGWLCDLIGRALARERRLMREHVKGELEALQQRTRRAAEPDQSAAEAG
jgi:hypothetical protein